MENNTVAKEEIVFGYNEEQMKTERKSQAKKGVIAGVVLLVFGGACVLGGVLTSINSRKIAAYPTVQAQVLQCSAVTGTNSDGNEYVDHFKVDLEYAVDGKTYTLTGKHSDKRMEGEITVHYNPGRPDKIYLEAQVRGEDNVYWHVIGGIVGALGLGVVFGERKNKRKLTEGQ